MPNPPASPSFAIWLEFLGKDMSSDDKNNPATAASAEISVRLDEALLGGLDAYAASERDMPSREEAVRRILHDWLRSHRHLRAGEQEEGTRPEDLSSANDG